MSFPVLPFAIAFAFVSSPLPAAFSLVVCVLLVDGARLFGLGRASPERGRHPAWQRVGGGRASPRGRQQAR